MVKITIKVKTQDREQFPLEIDSTMLISDIKASIAAKFNRGVLNMNKSQGNWCIIFTGESLAPGKSIDDYKINDGDTISAEIIAKNLLTSEELAILTGKTKENQAVSNSQATNNSKSLNLINIYLELWEEQKFVLKMKEEDLDKGPDFLRDEILKPVIGYLSLQCKVICGDKELNHNSKGSLRELGMVNDSIVKVSADPLKKFELNKTLELDEINCKVTRIS